MMHLAFLRLSLSSPLPSGTVLPLCSVLYLSLGAMLEPLCWNAVAMVQIPSTSSPRISNVSLSRQTQESGIKESLSWGTQRTQDTLYEARAPLERGHSAEIPVGQPGKLVSPPGKGCCVRRECVNGGEDCEVGVGE